MNNLDTSHNIIIEAREKLSISGVLDVEEFSENAVICQTTSGNLLIKGDKLHIEKLDLDSSELLIKGVIYSLEYNDTYQSGGFWSKLFK